jgi:tRNA nucleotidyltransferase (CCA-adding enzyme)
VISSRAIDEAPRPNVGELPTEEAALGALVDRLTRGLALKAVYLFGSRAEGRGRPDSDFDLLVVFDDSMPEERTTHEAVYAPVCGSGIGCDVVPCFASELEEVLHDPTNPWHRSWKGAKLLYERR